MQSPQKMRQLAAFVIFIGILAVSTAALFIRNAQADAPSLVIAAYRMVLASLILLPFTAKKAIADFIALSWKQRAEVMISGVFLSVHFAAWIVSLEMTSVTSSVVLVTTTPLWVALLSPLVLKEKMRTEIWWGLGLALSGGFIVAGSGVCAWLEGDFACSGMEALVGGSALLGNALALSGAWMAAGYLLAGRRVRPLLSLGSYTCLVYTIAAVFLILFVFVSGNRLFGYPPHALGWFVLLALVPQLLGHSSLNWALRFVPATFISLALLGEPVGATILAMIFLNELPLPGEIIGGLMILSGIYIASRTRKSSH
ncbi:MAG: DMT family transporter [Bellilinea sp.]